jgi:hypothetical protein
MAKSFKPIGTHAVHVLARLAARNEVKQQLRDQAIRPSTVKPAEISERAKAYLEQHPEVYEEAMQRAWKLGLIDQAARIDSAIFDDERRKSALVPDFRRGALFKTAPKPPVSQSDLAKTGADKSR